MFRSMSDVLKSKGMKDSLFRTSMTGGIPEHDQPARRSSDMRQVF